MASPERTNPFVGPQAFALADRDYFFGRADEIGELLSLVYANRLLVLYAPSGAGKTSLLKAGLQPRLEDEGFEMFPITRVSGIEGRGNANVYTANAVSRWHEDEQPESSERTLIEFLDAQEPSRDDDDESVPRVMVFDQFEELFTAYADRWEDRPAFFHQLNEVLESDPVLRVIISLREDYLAALETLLPLPAITSTGRFRLDRLREDAALAAVSQPAMASGVPFEPGVAEELVENLRTVRVEETAVEGSDHRTIEAKGEYVEPVQLQVVCQTLWDSLGEDATTISSQDLELARVDKALERFYERCLQATVEQTKVSEPDLRAWFEDRLITEAETRGSRYRGAGSTDGIPELAVSALEERHLIRGETQRGARWVELTHDRLIEPVRSSNQAWRRRRRARLRKMLLFGVPPLIAGLITALIVTNTGGEAPSPPVLSTALLEFGDVVETAEVVEVIDVSASSGWTATVESDLDVDNGCEEPAAEVCTIEVRYRPVSSEDELNDSLVVVFASGDHDARREVRLTGRGVPFPEAVLSDSPIDFGAAAIDEQISTSVALTNRSARPIRITDVAIEDEAAFSVIVVGSDCEGSLLDEMQGCDIEISFTARSQLGDSVVSDKLVVTYEDNEQGVSRQLSARLDGVAADPLPVVEPAVVEFGRVRAQGGSATREVLLRFPDEPYQDAVFETSLPEEFTVGDPECKPVDDVLGAVGQPTECRVTVEFMASDTAGPSTAELLFSYAGRDGETPTSPVVIAALAAESVDPPRAIARQDITDFPVGAGPVAIEVAFDAVWVTSLEGNSVWRLGLDGEQLGDAISIARPDGIADTQDGIWIVSQENRLYELDDVGNFERDFPLVGAGKTTKLAADFGSLWVVDTERNQVFRVDPQSEQARAIRVETNPIDIATAAGAVWVTNKESNSVTRIDPDTEETFQVVVGQQPIGIATGPEFLWVANSGDNTVSRIAVDTLDVDARRPVDVGRIPVDLQPDGVAVGEEAVWIANGQSGTVSRIDVVTFESEQFPVGEIPDGIAVTESGVWVANFGEASVSYLPFES